MLSSRGRWLAHTAREIGLVEAHGTGTALGDPTEAGALVAALEGAAAAGRRALGAAKANVGHAEAASGQVGLLRAVEQLGCGGNAHLRALNPLVAERLSGGERFHLAVQADSERPSGGACGVSAFGYSGTIAHVLLAVSQPLASCASRSRHPHKLAHRKPFAWADDSAARSHEASPYITFLGQLQPSSGSEQEWEQRLLPHELSFLQGHRVGWVALLPGTCYIELARAMVCST